MQQIRFRGRRADGRWLFGDLIHNRGNVYIADDSIADGNDIMGHTDFEVRSESVGQLTGCKDRNGRDIYEGDTLFYPETMREGVVGRIGAMFGLLIPDGAYPFKPLHRLDPEQDWEIREPINHHDDERQTPL